MKKIILDKNNNVVNVGDRVIDNSMNILELKKDEDELYYENIETKEQLFINFLGHEYIELMK